MNLSIWQWWAAFILDVLIKTALIYWSAALVSLGIITTPGLEPLIPFILIAVSLSGLHILCLFFGDRFVGSLQVANIQRSWARKFLLVLIIANLSFIVSFAAVLSVSGNVYDQVLLSTIAAATNLMPILLVAVAGGLLLFVARRA